MLAFALAVSLAAAPRPLPASDSGIFVPRMDRIAPLVAFMQRAGERSAMLRPQSWFSQFHPLIYVDFTRRESLVAAGIDPRGPVTVSFRQDGWMSCVEVADLKVFEKRAKERVASHGTLWEGKLQGTPVVAARTPDGEFRSGYAKSGKVVCAISATSNAQALLNSAAAAVTTLKLDQRWSEVRGATDAMAYLVTQEGAVTLKAAADGESLLAQGRTNRVPAPALVKGASSPYSGMAPIGLFIARAVVKKEELPRAVRSLVGPLASLCAKCSPAAVSSLERALASELTGSVAANVESARVRQKLRTHAERFFAVRHVWLAEVRDVEAVKKALAPLAQWPDTRPEGGGFVITLGGGEIFVGLHQKHLYLANDGAVLKAVTLALPEGAKKQQHGVELTLDPQKASRMLSQISFFDVIGSKELAGLFALSTEVGPLLGITQSVTGYANTVPGGPGHRYALTWTLQKRRVHTAPPAPGDGGMAPDAGPDTPPDGGADGG